MTKKLLALSVFVLTVFAGIAEPALAGVSSERGAPGRFGPPDPSPPSALPRLVGAAAMCRVRLPSSSAHLGLTAICLEVDCHNQYRLGRLSRGADRRSADHNQHTGAEVDQLGHQRRQSR
jgi:hypothetical protein